MISLKKVFDRIFMMNLQNRIILGFLFATCITGIVATMVGIRVIQVNTINEVERKVRQDINTARLIYDYHMERVQSQVQLLASSFPLVDALQSGHFESLKGLRAMIREDIHSSDESRCLDMLSLVDPEGRVLFRASGASVTGDNLFWDPVIKTCIQEKRALTSTQLMPVDAILRENKYLADRLNLAIIQTPQSVELAGRQLSDGMVLRTACPLLDSDNTLVGVLAGGTLLNKDDSIVDKIKGTVYQVEKYHGIDIGFATIFQGGVRISTNVVTEDRDRAIGTIVSREVYKQVVEEGNEWIGRAFVVNDWYISSYVPIRDINSNIIGMLYTGILEAKFRDMKWVTMLIFLGITALGMLIAFGISFYFGHSIIERIQILKRATEKIASGDLEYQLPRDKFSGFDILEEAFNNMARSLKDRDERLQHVFMQLTRTERLAALGQISAGVAHEINNPLGGILLYSNLVYEELDEDHRARENMEKIMYQTNRCKQIVQNLLDFARTPAGDMMPFNINSVILTSLKLVKDQSMFLGIRVETVLADDLPDVRGDRSRLEQVFLNLFLNAADAMNGEGVLTITSAVLQRHIDTTDEVFFSDEKICLLTSDKTVKVTIADTGKGINKAYLPHIFEPFFTTKDPGKGTGLGLSISYGIIQKHNGFIDVESEPGKGTSFIIALPAYEGDDTSSKANREKKEQPFH